MNDVSIDWRKAWREGLAPQLTTRGLEVLKLALASDDPRLLQGATTMQAPMQCVAGWAVEAACVIGYCGWQGKGLKWVGDVEEYFATVCYEADQALGVQAGCRTFLAWYDETPRDEMRRQLLAEVGRALTGRLRQGPSLS